MDGAPVFRNPEYVQVLPYREWMRQNAPSGRDGIVLEDLDLVVLRFGPAHGRPYYADGMFILVEIKYRDTLFTNPRNYAQWRTFGLMDRLLRAGDPMRKHYLGFYYVQWYDDHVVINETRSMSLDDFGRFITGDLPVEPFDFSKLKRPR